MKLVRILLLAASVLVAACSAAPAQQVPLQAGPWVGGHVPMYSGSGGTQPIIQDAGTAGGGAAGANPSEVGITARGTGTAPYEGQGHGPNGEILCTYDAPTTNATGYHYLCMSPNAEGSALITVGAGGGAGGIGLNFIIDGAVIPFPGNVVPNTWADNLTATGTTQGTAFTVSTATSAFTTVAASTGAVLPITTGLENGTPYTIINAGANPLNVYPPVGESINGGSTDAAVTIYPNGRATFNFRGSSAWYAR
jgi:hypothetical protein